MSDIVDRLRRESAGACCPARFILCEEAADEIENLRRAVRHESDCVEAAKAEIERLRAEVELARKNKDEAWACYELCKAEAERHADLTQAVEWMLDDGHMNQEHLARIRAAWEAAQEPRGRPAHPSARAMSSADSR